MLRSLTRILCCVYFSTRASDSNILVWEGHGGGNLPHTLNRHFVWGPYALLKKPVDCHISHMVCVSKLGTTIYRVGIHISCILNLPQRGPQLCTIGSECFSQLGPFGRASCMLWCSQYASPGSQAPTHSCHMGRVTGKTFTKSEDCPHHL